MKRLLLIACLLCLAQLAWAEDPSLSYIASFDTNGSAALGLGYEIPLAGPVFVEGEVFTDGAALLHAGLSLGENWDVYAGGGIVLNQRHAQPFYGGGFDYQVRESVWIGAWGYTGDSYGVAITYAP